MTEPTLQTVDRALTLLELLARHRDGLRPVDLTVLMGLNKVTVHR
ncbi:MAG: IclR family transcriptional regulator, partial [Clostridia bacterium]|nr:IclR family transcriptional regulator [Clostridia bacterium]